MGARKLTPTLALLLCVFLGAGFGTQTAGAKPRLSVKAPDSLIPGFKPNVSTYAARCARDELTIGVRGSNGWRTRMAAQPFRRGSYRQVLKRRPGQPIRITFWRKRPATVKRYLVRCLPKNFPKFRFQKIRSGGPRLFMMDMAGFAAVFNRNGVPVWWFGSDGAVVNTQILADGTFSFNHANATVREVEIRKLNGKFVRRIGKDQFTDVHDVQLLPNGNYLVGKLDFGQNVDTTEFGGVANGITMDTVIQERTPKDKVRWTWSSADHISLAETGRWRKKVFGDPAANWYDVSHWNTVEPFGKYMYVSFRNVDAVYKVNRRSGRIIWKLGGTKTPKSLRVLNYPGGRYPLGGQHDVRRLPDGTITIYNNRQRIPGAPQAERYRIDEKAGTARLIESVRDRKIETSYCCGSARKLPSKEWLISWGGTGNHEDGVTGAYDPSGRPIFRIYTPGVVIYRANSIPPGVATLGRLRKAMDQMYSPGGAGS